MPGGERRRRPALPASCPPPSDQRRADSPKLTILPHPRLLSSAATTPPIRFPIISFLLLTRTAALSSKRTYRPSGLRVGYFVRTTTARRTSPRRTLGADDEDEAPGPERGFGRARLTTTTISSPGDSWIVERDCHTVSSRSPASRGEREKGGAPIRAMPCPVFVLRTLTHSATSAPELSMMLCLIVRVPSSPERRGEAATRARDEGEAGFWCGAGESTGEGRGELECLLGAHRDGAHHRSFEAEHGGRAGNTGRRRVSRGGPAASRPSRFLASRTGFARAARRRVNGKARCRGRGRCAQNKGIETRGQVRKGTTRGTTIGKSERRARE